MIRLVSFEFLRARGLTAETLSNHTGREGSFFDYPHKAGAGSNGRQSECKRGLLITRQRGLEPNTPFPGWIGSELAGAGAPVPSSQTPYPFHSYKTGCCVPKRTRQVPAPTVFRSVVSATISRPRRQTSLRPRQCHTRARHRTGMPSVMTTEYPTPSPVKNSSGHGGKRPGRLDASCLRLTTQRCRAPES